MIKALTISQPYATLIAIGAKRIETRSWRTRYRGKIAIHAGQDRKFLPLMNEVDQIKQALARRCFYREKDLQFGRIIAIANLVDCVHFDGNHFYGMPETAFGDFTPLRFGFILEDVKQIEPVAVKGMQRLWNWNETGVAL